VHVHPRFVASASLCPRASRLSSSTQPAGRRSWQQSWYDPLWGSRPTASSPAATRDDPTAASRDVWASICSSYGWCPATPCFRDARSGKTVHSLSSPRPQFSVPPNRASANLIVLILQRQPGRRGSGSGFDYPDPTNANLAPVTPVSTPGYQAHTAPSPYYPPPHDRRTSPQSAYAYDARHSSSPHSSPYPPMAQGGPTPPPTSTPGGGGSARSGLNVRDMLNPGNNDSHGRSSTDSDMLNALNRRGPQ